MNAWAKAVDARAKAGPRQGQGRHDDGNVDDDDVDAPIPMPMPMHYTITACHMIHPDLTRCTSHMRWPGIWHPHTITSYHMIHRHPDPMSSPLEFARV